MKEEKISIPIYFTFDDKGEIFIDKEGITDAFNAKLEEIVKNPKKFLEV